MSNPMPGLVSALLNDVDDICPPGWPPHKVGPPHHDELRDVLLAAILSKIVERVSNKEIRSQLQATTASLHQVSVRALGAN